ncbi:hypothetical protein MASR2M78_22660 [Treponema sp.]
MIGSLKKFLSLPFRKRSEIDADALHEEKWVADFSNPRKSRFPDEDTESYQSTAGKDGLRLSLKKGSCLSWTEDPVYRYSDIALDCTIVFENPEIYAASGLIFRAPDTTSHYIALISTKGYFRLDAVFNGTPLPLIAWTELPGGARDTTSFRLRIIAHSDRISLIINEQWAGEVLDSTLVSGHIGFALVSYEDKGVSALLRSLRLESRSLEVEAAHLRWNALLRIQAETRLRLAETFAAMGQNLSALVQLKRAWKIFDRERTQAELLLAAKAALALSLIDEAEDYLERCIEIDPDSDDARSSAAEKAKLLYMAGRYAELKEHAEEAISLFPEDATLRSLLGHAYWNLGSAEKAATAYDAGLALNKDGIIAQNAAQAYEKMGEVEAAFERYLIAGRDFLSKEAYEDLAMVIPRLKSLKPQHPLPYALAGKYAFALEDWSGAEKELLAAELYRQALSKGESEATEDAASHYLRALLLIRGGKRAAALPLLERACFLQKDYAPFYFRLSECLFLLHHDSEDEAMLSNLAQALRLDGEDGWIANFAAQIALSRGLLEEASLHLEKASASLPREAQVQANKAELLFLQGETDTALALLNSLDEDKEGILSTEQANILVRLGRYEEADALYQKALRSSKDDVEYLQNRASCLIELGQYGEADELLARAFEIEPSVRTLELTAYVAVKKGELPRAEAACRVALELDPNDIGILSSLAWTYLSMSRWKSAEEVISRLEKLAIKDTRLFDSARELRERLTDATSRLVNCASCTRSWRVLKDAPSAPPLRLVAEPPDDLPAGTCVRCGKTYCIGCLKAMVSDGRFTCPECGQNLKFYDEGLKKLLADWAESLPLI